MSDGYEIYINGVQFPIAPSSLTVKKSGKNSTVTLISGGDVNVLKDPKLDEFSFDLLLPNSTYPFAKSEEKASYYIGVLDDVYRNKKHCAFTLIRQRAGDELEGIDTEVSIEDISEKEDAKAYGTDVTVSLSLKAWRDYGTKTLTVTTQESSSGSEQVATEETKRDDSTAPTTDSYTVKSGDTLWGIAKTYYGSGSDYTKIYEANSSVIEETAKAHGKSSSERGHWIYPGEILSIP